MNMRNTQTRNEQLSKENKIKKFNNFIFFYFLFLVKFYQVIKSSVSFYHASNQRGYSSEQRGTLK